MAQDLFRISGGLQIDEGLTVLDGAGVPGGDSGVQDAAPRGSFYSNLSDGSSWMKVGSGSGTGTWSQLATQTYVQNLNASGISWREPAKVVDSTSATTAAILVDLNADDFIQTVPVTVGMRILGSNVTGNKNVFIVGGVSGAWTLTEDVNLETVGDTLYVEAGVDTGKTFQYNGTDWIWINSSDADELGYIRTFVGKTGAGSETPTYTTNNIVTNAQSLETAIGKLDTETGYQNSFIGKVAGNDTPTYSSTNFVTTATDSLEAAIGKLDAEVGANVSNGTVILATNKVNGNISALDTELGSVESYLGKTVGDATPAYTSTTYVATESTLTTAISALDSALAAATLQVTSSGITTVTDVDTALGARMAEWDIRIVDASDSTSVYAAKLYATHNGVSSDFTKFAVLKLGTTIAGLTITVAYVAGDLVLRVASTTAVNVVSRRVSATV